MSQLSFTHLLNLSFAFHTRRKTGEILRILDRGAAINQTFEILLFNIIPTFFDIIIALVVFCYLFEWLLGLAIFIVMFAYSEWFCTSNPYTYSSSSHSRCERCLDPMAHKDSSANERT